MMDRDLASAQSEAGDEENGLAAAAGRPDVTQEADLTVGGHLDG